MALNTTFTGNSIVIECIETLKEGSSLSKSLPFTLFEQVAKNLDVSSKDLADVVSIPRSTLANRKKVGVLSGEEADRILRVERVMREATETLGSLENARLWMQTPSPDLNGLTPFEATKTDPGAEEVRVLLYKIGHGVVF